jgi:hypothetical protein
VTELLAQLAAHWDAIAALLQKRYQPRPDLTASILNLCTFAAENGLQAVSPSAAPGREDTHLAAGNPINLTSKPESIALLEQRVQQAESEAAAKGSELHQLRQQCEQQAGQIAALLAKSESIHTLQTEIHELASRVADQLVRQDRYYELIARVRNVVRDLLPDGATVLVTSKGDDQLISFGSQRGWHFPQTAEGEYAAAHPGDSAEAIAALEQMRSKGAEYLLIPQTAFWWLETYAEFRTHLESHYRLLLRRENTCVLFCLTNPRHPDQL